MKQTDSSSGMALIVVMFMITFLATMFAAYTILTRTELQLVKSSRYSQSGFNAAEAGLNLRAEEIRAIFLNYERPEGTSPGSIEDCDSGQEGEGDYICKEYDFENNHSAVTLIEEEPGNPLKRVIPPGESFAGLSAMEYRYNVTSVGRSATGQNEAILELTFMSRAVPLFQFAVFFDEDLEVFNGAVMTVDGPVHTNGDLYLAAQNGGQTNYTGPVSTSGTFYRGMKTKSSCSGYTGTARIANTPDVNAPNFLTLPAWGSRQELDAEDFENWDDNIILDIDEVEVPAPDAFASFSDSEYWLKADVRLVLRLDGAGNVNRSNSPTGVEVVDVDGVTDDTLTNLLHDTTSCSGTISQSGTNYVVGSRGVEYGANDRLRLYREWNHYPITNDYERTFEIDMQNLLNCFQRNPSILADRGLNDDTEQGLVFHLTIDGPARTSGQNNYKIRVRNGAELASTVAGAPDLNGLTLVSDQGIVIWGDYNSNGWIPAALMADTLWLLSNDWVDSDSEITDPFQRDGSATEVNAALISGIRRTGGANGPAGQNQGDDSNGGGVINVFRFNEWFRNGAASNIPDFTYLGSIVSLGPPLRSQSSWGPFNYYSAPNRDWAFEQRFNDEENLPPMTPTFIYLRQELFVRDYELS